VLTPRQSSGGVRTIEVSGDAVAINGERVNKQIVRDWLGDDARLILPLLDLSPAGRRELFGMSAETAPPVPTPEAAPTPEASEDETEVAETPETPEDTELETPEAPESPEAPEPPEPVIQSGSRVKFGGSILVEKEEEAEEAVAIGGSVRVEGRVTRDVVAIGGPVRVNGYVGGNVVSVGSSVYLGPGAVVDGDVNSAGGTIERAEGSQIHGSTSEVDPPWSGPWRRDRGFDPDFGPFSLFGASIEIFGSTVGMILLAILACLTLLIARGPVEQVDLRLRTEPLKSGLVGLAGILGSVPLIVVVLATLFVISVVLVLLLVGCLLLVLLPFFGFAMVLALLLALLLGYAGVALRVGRRLEARFGWRFASPYAAALVGVVAIQIWSVISHLLAMGPRVLDVFAGMFSAFGFVVQALAWILGFGAVLLSRFGAPPRYVPPAAMPATPATIPPPPPPVAPAYGGDLPLSEERWEEPPPEQ
jgi:cytoskeletal protein CcmA (bactofilin family)